MSRATIALLSVVVVALLGQWLGWDGADTLLALLGVMIVQLGQVQDELRRGR